MRKRSSQGGHQAGLAKAQARDGFWGTCAAKGCGKRAMVAADRVSADGRVFCASHKAQAKAPAKAKARVPGYRQARWGDEVPQAKDRTREDDRQARSPAYERYAEAKAQAKATREALAKAGKAKADRSGLKARTASAKAKAS